MTSTRKDFKTAFSTGSFCVDRGGEVEQLIGPIPIREA
jgi:hypothetical protein